MGWLDEQCDKAMSPKRNEILKRANEIAAPMLKGEAATITSCLMWWRLFKKRNLALKERAAQLCESQRADAKLTTEEWTGCFNAKSHPTLLRVNMKAQHVYNQDESGDFRSFFVKIRKVLARKGRRWVARRRGYDRTHITAMVCVSAAGKTVTPALLWTGKKVLGRLFSKQACHVFMKATQGDSKKNNQKATSSSESNAQDSKQSQNGPKEAGLMLPASWSG